MAGIEIRGAAQVREALRRLPREMRHVADRGAIRAAANVFVAAARKNVDRVPNLDAEAKQTLKDSIVATTGKVKDTDTTGGGVRIRTKAWWWYFFEWGTEERWRSLRARDRRSEGGGYVWKVTGSRRRKGIIYSAAGAAKVGRGYSGRITAHPFMGPAFLENGDEAVDAAVGYMRRKVKRELKKLDKTRSAK